jgi:FOG: WD40-like repeat
MSLRIPVVVFSYLLLLSAVTLGQVPSGDGDWPQWRGPNRDGISSDKGLLKEWPKEGPAKLWQVDSVGVGYSSMAVKDGRIFTQGDLNGIEHIIALDAKDGHTLWAVQPGPVAELLDTQVAAQFKQLDKNGDGTISEPEALARFGWEYNKFDQPASEPLAAIAKKRAEGWFQELDKNGDGKLGFDECANQFRDAFERIDSSDSKAGAAALAAERTAEYLKLLDKDGDGRVSRQECKGTALDRHFGRIDERASGADKGDELLSAKEIETSLKKFEAGKDGVITPVELEQFYVASKYTGDGVLTVKEFRSTVGGYRNGMGDGPRGTPTVDGDRLYAEGANGDVDCLEATTGKTIWHVNLRSDFGGGTPGWGYSESPLIVNDLVIVTPGGNAGTLVALNKLSGKPVWQSKEVKEAAHYSSPVLADIGGVRQIVQFARESVFGVSLTDGKPLWRYAAPANGTANCCAPIVDGDLVFASSSYGVGGGLAKINSAGSTQQAEEIYFEKRMDCHHGGIVKVGDYMYSAAAGALMCVEFKTGKIMWQSRGAGKGALCVADGMLYILGEGHEVALAEVSPDGYREHGKFKIQSHGHQAWAHPIVAGGRLFIRDQESLTAYDVRGK